MATIFVIFLIILVTILIILIILFAKIKMLKTELKIKECEKTLERNQAVYWYRKYWYKTNTDIYSKLPSYEELLKSNEPLSKNP